MSSVHWEAGSRLWERKEVTYVLLRIVHRAEPVPDN